MLKLFRYLKPFSFMIIGILVFVFLQTLGDLYLPTLMSDIIDQGVMQGDIDKIIDIGRMMLLVAALGIIAAIFASYISSKVGMGLGRILRNKIFRKVESFSLNEFDKLGTSTLITRTTNDITQVQMVTTMMLRMMINAPMMAVGGVILSLRKDKPLSLIFTVAVPVLAFVVIILASKVIPLFRQIQTKVDKINLVLREKLTGIRVIRAFNTVQKETIRFDKANDDLTNTYIKANVIMAFMMPSIMIIMNLTTLSILWFGGIRISNGYMELGALSAFTQYAMHIMFSMIMLAMMFIMVPRAQAAAVRISEVLEIEPDIKDSEDVKEFPDQKGYIEFKDVSFSYHGAEEPAIKDISFSAKPGEITAIIGSTGSGKSTLVNLIPRFYDIQKGSILIDEVDISEITQECLRAKIGFVPQKAFLFSGTIKENIKFGNKSANEEEVEKAAEVAQAAEFIDELDDRFEHEISQGGANVSGGQKQRLSIARALIRRPEIYIFDDSFSALDFKTDAKLRAALRKEIKDATVIVVAQRVGTVMDADRIIVMDEGKIVGLGNHKELLKSCEVYKEIVSSQLTKEEIA
ncbi:MAG: ABC transporter ATP-binding protein [Clostridiales bacterium]